MGQAAHTHKPGCCPNSRETSNLHCFSQCSISACVVEYCQAVNHQGNQGGCFSCFWACLPTDFFNFFFSCITTELINSKIEYQISKSHSLYAVF